MIWIDKIKFYRTLLKHKDTVFDNATIIGEIVNETLGVRLFSTGIWESYCVHIQTKTNKCVYDGGLIDTYYIARIHEEYNQKKNINNIKRAKHIFKKIGGIGE